MPEPEGRRCELLPAIDLRQGQVVRLTQGDDARRRVYREEPLGLLADFHAAGVERVHIVDLDAALGEAPQAELLARLLASGERPAIQLGGGLRSLERIEAALAAGCERAVVGSLLLRNPEGFAECACRHPGRLVPALDCSGGAVRLAGWKEEAEISLADACAGLVGLPCPAVLVTDIERDGTLWGPNLDLAARVGTLSGLPALVSGGVRALADLEAAAARPGIGGVVVGKALYEGAFTLAAALAAVAGGG